MVVRPNSNEGSNQIMLNKRTNQLKFLGILENRNVLKHPPVLYLRHWLIAAILWHQSKPRSVSTGCRCRPGGGKLKERSFVNCHISKITWSPWNCARGYVRYCSNWNNIVVDADWRKFWHSNLLIQLRIINCFIKVSYNVNLLCLGIRDLL